QQQQQQQQQEHEQQSQDHQGEGENAQNGIERDVGTILAGLNQEQLASIVAAARASEAGNQAPGQTGESAYNAENGAYTPGNPLADLPPGLGQAASALTSFASSFKRTGGAPGIGERDAHEAHLGHHDDKLGDAPPPPGTEYQAQELQHQQQELTSEQQEHAAAAAHDASATAAALAAMGTLAGHHLNQQNAHQGQASPQDSHAMVEGLDHGAAASPSGRAKKPRAPELDRARKDNHKEVERRRRSAINDGINQLSQIVPGCDAKNTNKGSIIVAAVRYIQDLKNNEASNIEKWTLEKLLMDQAMNDLTAQLDEIRRENDKLRAQLGIEARDEEQAAPPPPALQATGAGEKDQSTYYQHANQEQHDQAQAHEQNEALDPNLPTSAEDVDRAEREQQAAAALSQAAVAAVAAAQQQHQDEQQQQQQQQQEQQQSEVQHQENNEQPEQHQAAEPQLENTPEQTNQPEAQVQADDRVRAHDEIDAEDQDSEEARRKRAKVE
ncbi:hypothetical protein IE53DRAFT_391283, partial [Violaceomyces palustris]